MFGDGIMPRDVNGGSNDRSSERPSRPGRLQMKSRKWIVFSVIVILVGLSSFLAYRAIAKHRDLAQTLRWMEQTYNPHDGGANYGRGRGDETHYLEHSDTQTEEITEEFQETFTTKGGCILVLHQRTVPIGVFKSVYTDSDYTLSLGDVDPNSIKIKTYDFHKDVFNCADPTEVKLYDLDCSSAEIEFQIRNEAPKIRDDGVTIYAELKGKDHEAQIHEQVSKGWFSVDDATYAGRFAKAFGHAVELCGGRPSRF